MRLDEMNFHLEFWTANALRLVAAMENWVVRWWSNPVGRIASNHGAPIRSDEMRSSEIRSDQIRWVTWTLLSLWQSGVDAASGQPPGNGRTETGCQRRQETKVSLLQRQDDSHLDGQPWHLY